MAKIYVFLAEGFEEIEALAPVDVLRRGGQEVVTLSVTGQQRVCSSHGVTIEADQLLEDVNVDDADVLLLPGGMPGASNLNAHNGVREALLKHNEAGKRIGAICAAPMVLGSLGLLDGKKATCYPGFEDYLTGAEYTATLYQEADNIITGEGPAAAFPYAYKILSYFVGEEATKQMQEGMMYAHLMQSK